PTFRASVADKRPPNKTNETVPGANLFGHRQRNKQQQLVQSTATERGRQSDKIQFRKHRNPSPRARTHWHRFNRIQDARANPVFATPTGTRLARCSAPQMALGKG
uniref:Uncharacterized protein n=1 Tax=Anopheles atroparvus TaxID=41427 RepID=A0AAG5DKR5_ANOAO